MFRFSQADLEVQKYSFSEGLVNAFFTLYEGIAWLKNEEYGRMEAIEPYWLAYRDPENQMIKAIQEKLLEKIKERVEENFKNHYPSMIKVFLYLYSGELYIDNPHYKNPILLYFREIFKSRIIPAIRTDKKFREHNMPSSWQFDKQNSIFRISYEDKVIIDKASKKREMSAIKKKFIKKPRKPVF